jgi:hypothetical protein
VLSSEKTWEWTVRTRLCVKFIAIWLHKGTTLNNFGRIFGVLSQLAPIFNLWIHCADELRTGESLLTAIWIDAEDLLVTCRTKESSSGRGAQRASKAFLVTPLYNFHQLSKQPRGLPRCADSPLAGPTSKLTDGWPASFQM